MKMIQRGLFRVCFHPITMLNCCTICISWEIGSYNTQQSRHDEHPQFCREMIIRKWGGQRPFGTSPKIHPFLLPNPSLKMQWMIWRLTACFYQRWHPNPQEINMLDLSAVERQMALNEVSPLLQITSIKSKSHISMRLTLRQVQKSQSFNRNQITMEWRLHKQ